MAGPSAGSNSIIETTTAGTSTVDTLKDPSAFETGRAPKGQPPITPDKIRDKYIRGARAVRPQARQYWINRAFLEGQQWIWWDRVRGQVNELPRDERVRAVMNLLWGNSRRVIAKLVQRELVFEVPPQSPDDSAVLGALTAEAVLRHTWKEHNWENLRAEVEWMRWLGGTAILGLEWDPKAGTELGYDPDSEQKFGTGDIREQVYSIGEVCTEPGARDIEKAGWWVRALAMPPEEVKARYGLKETPEADAAANLQPWQARVTMVERGEMPLPLCLVLTYYERPGPSNPDGVVATVVGDQIVEWCAWPFPFKERLNLVCFRETQIADRWMGATVFSAGVPIQTAYNASWSAIVEHMKKAGNARLMVPEGSVDDEDAFTDDPDSIVTYNAASGGEPKYLSPPNMPQWWVEQPSMLETVLNDILGIGSPVSKGQAPANIESGVGLSILSDEDQDPITMMVKDQAQGWSRYGQMVLKVYEKEVSESRPARISREGSRAPTLINWTGKSFQGQTEVDVPLEAIVPRSKAARQAWATALFDRKLITTPEQFAKVAELPSRDDFTTGLDPDLAKAQRENHTLAMGGVCIPEEFDNHVTHINTHNGFRKSERYDSLPDVLRKLVDDHVQAHAVIAAEAKAKMATAQQVSPALAEAPNANETAPVAALHAPGAPPAPGAAPGMPGGGPSTSQMEEEMENAAPPPGDPAVSGGSAEVFTPPIGPDYPVDALRAPSRLGPTV